ncbi:MAG: RHS repeat domain-containing protein [Salibacteraceae bacterium]
MNYTLEEYHYTLFYYDQAGNLIKTVPPQAVHDHLQDPNGVQLFEAGNATAFSVADAAVARNSNYTSNPFLHPEYELITNYRYNSLQNLVQQQTPDGGQSKLWYDGINRVVASQNAKQVAAGNGQYSYVVHDDLGRPIEGGELTGGAIPSSGHYLSLTAYQNWLATATGNRTQVTRTYYDASIHQGITAQFNSGQQNLRNRVSTSAYFEEYTPGITAATDYAYASHYSYDIHGNVIELVQQNNELKDLGQEYKKLEYDFDLVSGNVNQVSYQAGQYDEFYHRYCYDADNRITRVLTSRDGKIYEQDKKYLYYAHGPLARVETGSEQVQGCDYAYTLQGWQKGINASTGRADLDPGQDGNGATTLHQQFGQDAMGFSLHYYQGDYTRIASSAPNHLMASNNVTMNAQSADLFNGNISKMVTALTNTNNTPERVIANAYQYDQKNRLRYFRAYQDLNSFADNLRSSNGMAAGNFSNRYAGEYHYDANGNITELKRTGDQGTLNDMDRFTYNYNVDQNGKLLNNQLDWVDDPATATAYANDMDGQAAGNYTYDPIGQLESDRKEEIDNIEWYVFNKPKKVTRTGNQINGSYPADLEFRYGPNGNRCVKIAKPWSNNTGHDNEANWTYTYYVRDAAGNIMATYERTFDPVAGNTYKDQLALTEHDIYGASRAGLHLPTELKHEVEFSATSFNGDKEFSGTSYTALPDYSEDHQLAGTSNRFEYLRDLGAKQYELTNHLGNVLETVSDRKVAVDNNADDDIDNYFAQVISYSDYYPFGMQMPERTGGTLSRYGFNGMERDDELKGSGNSYDFGARIYDSRLGKFNSVDPRERDFPFMSPYCFAANMPISAIDENGEGPDIVIFSVKVTEEIKKLLANGLQVKAMTKANYYLRHGFVDDNNNPSNWQQREMVKQNVDIPLKVLLNQSAAYSHDRGEHKDGYTYLYGYQLVDGVYQNVYLGRVPDEWWHSTQNKNRVRVNAHEAGFWDEWSDEKNKDYEEWLARNVSGNTVEVDDPVNEMTEYDRRMLYESGEEGPFDHLVHNPKNDFEYSDEDDVSWDELKEGDYYYTEGEWRDYHWQQLEVKTSTDPWGYKVVELPEGQDYEDFLRLDRETRPKPTNTNGN